MQGLQRFGNQQKKIIEDRNRGFFLANTPALLARIPECHTLVTTGEKASQIVADTFNCPVPPVGGYVDIEYETPNQVGGDGGIMPGSVVMPGPDRASLRFWRMPSTSRTYPLSIEKKAEAYRQLF